MVRRLRSALHGTSPVARTVTHGSPRRSWIALTFDEFEDQEPAVATLDVLEAGHVPATIFLTGRCIEEFPQVARRIAGLGLEVGDHSYSHRDLAYLAAEELHAEIGTVAGIYREVTGAESVPLFRPPYGSLTDSTRQVAAECGFPLAVLWSVDPEDWKGGSASDIEDHVVDKAHPGAIVLMHLGAPGVSQAVPGMVSRLSAQGYEFVTLSRMLRVPWLWAWWTPDAILARLVRDFHRSGS
jgi:peptidoglycan/xylan/chitin deacetylase (PgdA/CDA1 family)